MTVSPLTTCAKAAALAFNFAQTATRKKKLSRKRPVIGGVRRGGAWVLEGCATGRRSNAADFSKPRRLDTVQNSDRLES